MEGGNKMKKIINKIKRIINKLKRFYFKIKNSDPVIKCDYYKEIGCGLVDSFGCDVKTCITNRIYKESKDKNFVSCVNCVFQDECCSNQFGLGCNEGRISK